MEAGTGRAAPGPERRIALVGTYPPRRCGIATFTRDLAAGLERVALMLPNAAIPPAGRFVVVAGFGTHGAAAGIRLLYELRTHGVRSDMDTRAVTLKSHLKQADRLGATFVVIIGDDEAASGRAIIRNMATKDQQDVPMRDVARFFSDHPG